MPQQPRLWILALALAGLAGCGREIALEPERVDSPEPFDRVEELDDADPNVPY